MRIIASICVLVQIAAISVLIYCCFKNAETIDILDSVIKKNEAALKGWHHDDSIMIDFPEDGRNYTVYPKC